MDASFDSIQPVPYGSIITKSQQQVEKDDDPAQEPQHQIQGQWLAKAVHKSNIQCKIRR